MNYASLLFPNRSPWLPRAIVALGLSASAVLAEPTAPTPARRLLRVCVLLSGDSEKGGTRESIAEGHASAVFNTTKSSASGATSDSISVHANKITYADSTLSCEGAVRVESQGTVTEGENMVIHLDAEHCQIFFLNKAGLK